MRVYRSVVQYVRYYSTVMNRRDRLLEELERCAHALRECVGETEPSGDAADIVETIPTLVGLLQAGQGAAGNAAWAISRLTSASHSPQHAAGNKVIVRRAGGIAPLVNLLHSGIETRAATAAASALQNLASHSNNFAEAVLGAISESMPSLEPFPYLLERLRPVAMKRMRRLEGGVDGQALLKAIGDAELVCADAASVGFARSRLAEMPMLMEKRREALGITEIDPPDDFLCPITCEKMVDPVVASDGHSYERQAIEEVIGGTKVSPLTREVLEPIVYANTALLKRIRSYDDELLRAVEISTKSRGVHLQ